MPTITTLSGQVIAVDLGTRDFESYRNSILGEGGLADAYTPNWTDRSELDLGVAMAELFSFMGDNLSWYQDRCANEALFTPAVLRRSVIQQCKMMNYELRPNVSASVELTFECNSNTPSVEPYVSIPANTVISVDTSSGADEVSFELLEQFIPTGPGTYTGIVAVHGNTVTDDPFSSDGSLGQRFNLAQTPLTTTVGLGSSLEVWVNEGVLTLWTEVDNFLESEPTDKVYKVEIAENDIVTIIFGDNLKGKIPEAGVSNIVAIYRVGGGREGNEVGRDKLSVLSGSFNFVDSVTNPLEPSGGLNRESIANAKKEAPLNLKAMNRAVTHGDYITLAKRVGGVSQAYSTRGAGAFEERLVIAAGGSNPVPTGSWDPYTEIGTGLLGLVGTYISERKTTPVILHVDPVRMVDINLDITAYLYSNVRQSDVQKVIINTVKLALNIDRNNVVLGSQLPLSYIMDVVESVSGVDYLNVNRFQRQPTTRNLRGQTDITFGSWVYGSSTGRETWTIRFLSATTFSVSGYSKGPQVNIGTVGTAYLVDDGTFGFTATAATAPNIVDAWEIVTGPYVGNIDPAYDELCRLLANTLVLNLSGGVVS